MTPFSQQTHTDVENVELTVNQSMMPNTISLDITDESNNSLDFNGGWVILVISVS